MKQDDIKIKGFFRVQLVETDENNKKKIIGDSGWQKNQVTNDGFDQYVCKALGSISGSKYVSHMALGTGGVPATDDTSLSGEIGTRQAVTAASSNTSKTVRFTATFASGWHTLTTGNNISNIGLFNTSSGGTLFAGNTYASSTCASNQAVNCTYDITVS